MRWLEQQNLNGRPLRWIRSPAEIRALARYRYCYLRDTTLGAFLLFECVDEVLHAQRSDDIQMIIKDFE
jgi:hypothetical protein